MLTTTQLVQEIFNAKNGCETALKKLWEYYYPLCYNIALYELKDPELALEVQVELTNHLIGEDGALYNSEITEQQIHGLNKVVIRNWLIDWQRTVLSKRPDTCSVDEVSELSFLGSRYSQEYTSSQEHSTEENNLLDLFAEDLPGVERKIFEKIRNGFDQEDICRSFGLTRGTGKYYYYLLRRKATSFAREHGFND